VVSGAYTLFSIQDDTCVCADLPGQVGRIFRSNSFSHMGAGERFTPLACPDKRMVWPHDVKAILLRCLIRNQDDPHA
jgi:hypothetical protein